MSSGAQSRLGELFVDVGVGGVGKTLKSLNSISASFLLTKNAALQAIKPFINIGKNAINSAVGIGKMAAALGTTAINAQKLQYYLNRYDAKGLEGNVASLQQTFQRFQSGLGGFDGQMLMSAGMLGVDLTKYSGSFEDTLQFIQDVKDALKNSNLTEAQQLVHLQNLGLQDWKYLFEKEDFNIKEPLRISDETFENLQKTQETINEIKNEFDTLGKNLTNTFAKNGGLGTLKDINKSFQGDTTSMAKLAGQTLRFINPSARLIFNKQGEPINPFTDWQRYKTEIIGIKPKTKLLETVPKTDNIYQYGGGEMGLPSISPPKDKNNITLRNNINIHATTTDSNPQFEILDINVEEIQNQEAMTRNMQDL